MKSDLQVKFLNYMTGRKKGEGFTLIELLVVIIIIGILAAIALPSFLNQANKAKQSEAKQYVGTIVRAQQAHYLENTQFASDFDSLSKPVATETTNYKYTLSAATATSTFVNVLGTAQKTSLKGYGGSTVVQASVGATSESTSLGAVCEMKSPGTGEPNVPTFTTSGVAVCPAATSKLLGS